MQGCGLLCWYFEGSGLNIKTLHWGNSVVAGWYALTGHNRGPVHNYHWFTVIAVT